VELQWLFFWRRLESDENMADAAFSFYVDRVARRYRHYCHPGGTPSSGVGPRKGEGFDYRLLEQPQAIADLLAPVRG
jgi:hypothetical protein